MKAVIVAVVILSVQAALFILREQIKFNIFARNVERMIKSLENVRSESFFFNNVNALKLILLCYSNYLLVECYLHG